MIDPAFSQRIKLKFSGLTQDNVTLTQQALTALGAVDNIRMVIDKGIVTFRYDASQVTLQECLNVLSALDIALYSSSLWWRWKTHLAFQLDANIRANARHIPHCCGKAPSGPRR